MKLPILYLVAVLGMLSILEKCSPPNSGDADVRGPAKLVTKWPWQD